MAYSIQNAPRIISQLMDGTYNKWVYIIPALPTPETPKTGYYAGVDDTMADIQQDGYFTNAEELGMKVGDKIEIRDSAGVIGVAKVASINADGEADLTDIVTEVTTTDSD